MTRSNSRDAELTVRAIITGTLLGAVLSLCNIYSGLRIGWGFNMSITAALLGWGFWRMVSASTRTPMLSKLENNLNQTGASAGASISSAGLVSAIPAMTMLTGRHLSFGELVVWTGIIGLTGVTVGIALRRQMIEVDKLPFASGIASAETLDKMYAQGADALTRVRALIGAGAFAGGLKAVLHYAHVPNFALPGSIAVGAQRASLMNLTVALDPSPLMVAVGALGSVRTGVTMLCGSLFSWLVLGPYVIAEGWATPGADDPSQSWFGPMVRWLLWPGVAMMVTSSLTSVAFSWRSIVRTFTGGKIRATDEDVSTEPTKPVDEVPRKHFFALVATVMLLGIGAQVALFGIAWWAALIGVLLSFVLAAVAGRVSGETAITPVGAMGKVTQAAFALLQPGSATANLMAANVTGGAASQCADLLHDMKAGSILGASPRRQAIAQSAGVLGGAVAGSAAYLVLVPDPAHQLLTDAWPAPAVATWRAVAELFAEGLSSMPQGAMEALAIGGSVGVLLAILERTLPKPAAMFVPSPASLGLAFTIQAWTSFSLFAGSMVGFALRRWAPAWSERYLSVVASGIIAGESLIGVGIAVHALFGS